MMGRFAGDFFELTYNLYFLKIKFYPKSINKFLLNYIQNNIKKNNPYINQNPQGFGHRLNANLENLLVKFVEKMNDQFFWS